MGIVLQSGCKMECLLLSVLRILTDNSHHGVEVSNVEAFSCHINEKFHHSCTLLFLYNLEKNPRRKGWSEFLTGCPTKGTVAGSVNQRFKTLSS